MTDSKGLQAAVETSLKAIKEASLKVQENKGVGNLITIRENGTISEAVASMSQNNVLSLPVLDESGSVSGFVDMLDVIAYIGSVTDLDTVTAEDLTAMRINETNLAQVPVREVMDKSGRNPYVPTHETASLSMVLPFFAVGVHRTVLLDPQGEQPKCIFSQSDTMRFLLPELKANAAEFAAKSLSDLGFTQKEVTCIAPDTSVISALKTLLEQKLQAVAMVENKTIVGDFSAWDVRGLDEGKMSRLLESAGAFVGQRAPHTASPDDSLLSVIDKVVTNKLHRLWIVDDGNAPIGVITLTDLIKIIKEHSR